MYLKSYLFINAVTNSKTRKKAVVSKSNTLFNHSVRLWPHLCYEEN